MGWRSGQIVCGVDHGEFTTRDVESTSILGTGLPIPVAAVLELVAGHQKCASIRRLERIGFVAVA